MNNNLFRVVSQGTVSYVPSLKQEGGQLAKCVIRLKEFGGGKFGNEYLCTMFGNLSQRAFREGDLVIVAMRFQVHEINGSVFQEIIINDIELIECNSYGNNKKQ